MPLCQSCTGDAEDGTDPMAASQPVDESSQPHEAQLDLDELRSLRAKYMQQGKQIFEVQLPVDTAHLAPRVVTLGRIPFNGEGVAGSYNVTMAEWLMRPSPAESRGKVVQ